MVVKPNREMSLLRIVLMAGGVEAGSWKSLQLINRLAQDERFDVCSRRDAKLQRRHILRLESRLASWLRNLDSLINRTHQRCSPKVKNVTQAIMCK
jgi:hypothetical protein